MDPSACEGFSIVPANAGHVDAIGALLRAAGLPADDFAAHLKNFLILSSASGQVAGTVGLEVAGGDVLLRSLVVAPAARRGGWGRRLVVAILEQARREGAARAHLLTTEAEGFFLPLGFRRAERAAAPAAIAATRQFQELCPASAVYLVRSVATAPAADFRG